MPLTSHLKTFVASTTIIALLSVGQALQAMAKCPESTAGLMVFPDGALLMKTALAVNPDGTAASYLPGDHGYTYLANGVNLIVGGEKIACLDHASLCREKWSEAEAADFGPGSPEFCVFALQAAPYEAGGSKSKCEGDRHVVGNGKGRPTVGRTVLGVDGGEVPTYLSTTSLRHTVDGNAAYVDSAIIPGLVVPRSRSGLVGALAWVRYGNRETFAIVNDTGPRFGEGSIALHQFLRYGSLQSEQAVGPISVDLRCGPAELGLKPPFQSKPDLGRGDRCRPGYQAKGASDIRAYNGIPDDVVTIILADLKPPMTSGRVVAEELTVARLREWILDAGYTKERLNDMASCLGK